MQRGRPGGGSSTSGAARENPLGPGRMSNASFGPSAGASRPFGGSGLSAFDPEPGRQVWAGTLEDLRDLAGRQGFAISLNRPLPETPGRFRPQAAASSGTPLLTLWGQQAGSPAEDGDGTLFWGMDARGQVPGREWVAGLALAESDISVFRSLSGDGAGVTGFAESGIAAVYPYARASLGGGLTLWGMAGSGSGTVDSLWSGDGVSGIDLNRWRRYRTPLHMDPLALAEGADLPEGSVRLDGDLAFGMGLFGAERVLHEGDGLSLSVLGDAGWSRLSVESGAAAGISASVSRTRLGLRADYASPDGVWTGGLRVSGRVDGGDGETGSGVEIAGDARRGWGRWHAGLEGHWYTADVDGVGAGSRRLSATLGLDHRGDGTGLAFGLTPGWGGDAPAARDTGLDGLLAAPGDSAVDADPSAWLGSRAAWGARLPGRMSGLMVPHAEMRLERGGGRHVRAGIDLRALGGAASLGIAVDHKETGTGPATRTGAVALRFAVSF